MKLAKLLELRLMLKSLLGLLFLFSISCSFAEDLSAKQQVKLLISQNIQAQIDEYYNEYKDLNIKYRFPRSATRLALCEQELRPASENSSLIGSQTWWIECPSKWRVKVSVTASLKVKAVTTTHTLKKNHRLLPEDVTLDWHFLRYDHDIYQNIDSVVGSQLRRTVKSNTLLSDNHIKLRHVIEKGQTVIIRYQSDNFMIETGGIALESGQIGDRIEVENARSGTPLRVTVIDHGRVRRY